MHLNGNFGIGWAAKLAIMEIEDAQSQSELRAAFQEALGEAGLTGNEITWIRKAHRAKNIELKAGRRKTYGVVVNMFGRSGIVRSACLS